VPRDYDDREATIRTFLARFEVLVDEFNRNASEIEFHQRRGTELGGRQDELRGMAAQLVAASDLLGFNIYEEVERRSTAGKAEPAPDATAAVAPQMTLSSPPSPRPTVRQFILRESERVYPEPVRAAGLRQRFLDDYGVPVHEKTFGMTLYRLSREKPPRMRREGKQDWFFVPPETNSAASGVLTAEQMLS